MLVLFVCCCSNSAYWLLQFIQSNGKRNESQFVSDLISNLNNFANNCEMYLVRMTNNMRRCTSQIWLYS